MKPRILVYDIETAGVNALNADLGYVITFGYIWYDDFLKGKKWKTISIGDFKLFKKDPHDDTLILNEVLKILKEASHIIHHYGNRFDQPYLASRLAVKNFEPFPEVKALDTCWLAWKKFKLSSNRLANIAKFLNCKYQKEDKKDGWPKWWMAYLKGSLKYDKQMRHYCGLDVMTLAEIAHRMQPYWPDSFINFSNYTHNLACKKCGGVKLWVEGNRIIGGNKWKLYSCQDCGYSYNKVKLESIKLNVK